MKSLYTMYAYDHDSRIVVGYAHVIIDKNEHAHLTRVWVVPEHRGKGHGQALLRVVTRDADRERRMLETRVDPDAGMDFQRLVSFYAGHGFTMTGDGVTMVRKWVQLPKPRVDWEALTVELAKEARRA